MVRWRRDERNAGLRMAQPRDEPRYLVPGQLPTLAGLRALGHLDFNLFRVAQVLRRDAEAPGGDLLGFVVEQQRRHLAPQQVQLGVSLVHGAVFAALACVGARAQHIHGGGHGLVSFRA